MCIKGVVRLTTAPFYIWTNYSKCVIIWLNTENLSEYEGFCDEGR